MWKNRLNRIRNAWSDPESQSQPFMPNRHALWWGGFVLNFAILTCLCFEAYEAKKMLYVADMLLVIPLWLSIFIIGYLLGIPHAKSTSEASDHIMGFMLGTIFSMFILCIVLFSVIEGGHEKQPVTQEVYNAAKAADPSCARYHDYHYDRLSKNQVLIIRDLKTAKTECREARIQFDLLTKQKAFK
jgi:hypothetical protein